MRRSSAIALAVATSAILVGCDKCSRDKAQTSTTAETATQPAAEGQSSLTDQSAPAAAPTSELAAPATEPQAETTAADSSATNPSTTDAAATATQPAATPAATEPAPVTGSLKITDVKKGSG
jgi:hypothetical protein